MAIENIDLSQEIESWKSAVYGKEVRAANVAAFEKIQGTVNDTVQNVNQAAEDVVSTSNKAQQAIDSIQEAIVTTTQKAAAAETSATEAASSQAVAASSKSAAAQSETNAAGSAAEARQIAEGLGGFDGSATSVSAIDTQGISFGRATGTKQVTVTDAWDAPVVDMEIEGASEQVTTTGAQLLAYPYDDTIKTTNGVTFTAAKDGSVVISGTATGSAYFYIHQTPFALNSGNYVLSGGVNGADVRVLKTVPPYESIAVSANGKEVGFILEEKGTVIIDIIVRNEASISTTLYPMLNEGTVAQPWEPYTGGQPSPSPAYPQAIKGVEHVVNGGAQLFDTESLKGTNDSQLSVFNRGRRIVVTGSRPSARANAIIPLDLVKGKTITLSGTIDKSGDEVAFHIVIELPDGQKKYYSAKQSKRTVTVPENSVGIALELCVNNSGIVLETSNTVIFTDVMLSFDENASWEPYNNQQRETDLQVDIAGKNLFNKQAVYSYNVGAVDIVQTDGGLRIYNNTARTYACAATKVKLKPNTTYTYSCKIANPRTKSAVGIRKSLDNGNSFDPTMISGTGVVTTAQTVSRSFKTDENEYYAVCLFCTYDDEVAGDTTFEDIQLEEGAAATEWEPYDEPQTVTIPLDEPLRGIGDVRDRIAYKDGVWGIERNVGKVDNNQWKMNNVESGTTGHRFFYIAEDIVEQPKARLCCAKYTQKDNVVSFSDKGDYISSDETHTAKRINIRTLGKDFVTIEDFKAFMSDAETIYPLATPTWTTFPAETQTALNALTTHPGTTTVIVKVDESEPDITMQYCKQPGAKTNVQSMLDVLAHKVALELIAKNKIVKNLLATDVETVLSGALGPIIDQRLTDLMDKYTQLNGEIIISSGSMNAVKGTENEIITLKLLAGHSYLIIAFVGVSITDSSSPMSNTIRIKSGTAKRVVGGNTSRTYMTQGGGSINYLFVECSSDVIINVCGYGYSNETYNYYGNIVAIPVR